MRPERRHRRLLRALVSVCQFVVAVVAFIAFEAYRLACRIDWAFTRWRRKVRDVE